MLVHALALRRIRTRASILSAAGNLAERLHPPQPVLDKQASRACAASRSSAAHKQHHRANGIDWTSRARLCRPCGNEANFAGIRERVKKMADIGRLTRWRARPRPTPREAGHKVTRATTISAAVHWGAAVLRSERQPTSRSITKNACYGNAPRLPTIAWRRWVPFKDKAIPAWFHLPPAAGASRR
jgi:hypothetical protein